MACSFSFYLNKAFKVWEKWLPQTTQNTCLAKYLSYQTNYPLLIKDPPLFLLFSFFVQTSFAKIFNEFSKTISVLLTSCNFNIWLIVVHMYTYIVYIHIDIKMSVYLCIYVSKYIIK